MVHTTQAPATVAVSAQLNSTGATARVHGPQLNLRRTFLESWGQISCAKLIAIREKPHWSMCWFLKSQCHEYDTLMPSTCKPSPITIT